MNDSPADRHARRANDRSDAYRKAAAKLLLELSEKTRTDLMLQTSPHGLVQPMEDGAFVEVMLWVPRSALEKAGD
jgi:alpha-galactosidase/6-phospho-beta-glucosidase family protein